MKLPSHLKRSGHGIYYFRVVIPKDIRQAIGGQHEWKVSLKTRDTARAKQWSYLLSPHVQCWLNEARRAMGEGKKPQTARLRDIVGESTNSANRAFKAIMKPDGKTLDHVEVDPDKPGDAEAAARFLGNLGPIENIAPVGPDYYLEKPHSQSPGAPTAMDAEAFKRQVKDAIREHSTEQEQGVRLTEAAKLFLDDWGPHKRQQAKSETAGCLRDLESLLGDVPVTKIDRRALANFDAWMRDKAPNKRGGSTGLVPATRLKRMSYLNAFFDFLHRKGHFPDPKPPSQGQVKFTSREKQAAIRGSSYQPFTNDELRKIFDPENLWFRRSHSEKQARVRQPKPHEFWMPLLGLFTGARLNELAQLALADISRRGDLHIVAITVIDQETGEHQSEKSLKTASARRVIPIHPRLIEVGFLDYLEDVRSIAGATRVFPYLTANRDGNFGGVPSEAFGRYLDSPHVGITSSRKTFHSFRHTATRLLESAGYTHQLDKREIRQMVGHANPASGTETYYAGISPEVLAQNIVPHFDFPFLNYSRLVYKPGTFASAIHSEMARRKRQLNHKNAKVSFGPTTNP